jgi:dTDP-4-amino-4,6-dideoxygalactose transaminase
LKSGSASKAIFWASNRLLKLTRVSLAKKHFQYTDGWVVLGPRVLELWRQKKLTPQMTYQLMTYAGRYWHAREMDKYEILQLTHELEKTEDYLQDRRRTAGIYKDLLESEHFSTVDVKRTSKPSYLRYPVRVDDSRKMNKCVEELASAGFVTDLRYPPLHSSLFFSWASPNASFEGSVHVYQNILPLPIYSHMDISEVERVASIVKSVFSG